MIIALSGQIGSGKTTAANHLNRSRGFTVLSTRNLLSSILRAKNLDVNRKNLQDLGSALILLVGGGGFVAMMLEYLPDGNYVLDAIRYSEAIHYLKLRYGSQFRHVHLTTNDMIRYSRLQKRDGPQGSSEDYKESEQAETELGGPELHGVADFRFDNGGTLKTFYSELDGVVDSMKPRVQ